MADTIKKTFNYIMEQLLLGFSNAGLVAAAVVFLFVEFAGLLTFDVCSFSSILSDSSSPSTFSSSVS